MIQKAKFLIFCMIFVVGSVFGQKTGSLTQKISIPVFTKSDFTCGGDSIFYTNYLPSKNHKLHFNKLQSDSLIKAPISFNNNYSINIIAPNYYTQNFGFFCKKELQLQKAIKVPFVFRLGSVEMCDRMEGKRR